MLKVAVLPVPDCDLLEETQAGMKEDGLPGPTHGPSHSSAPRGDLQGPKRTHSFSTRGGTPQGHGW